MYVIADDKKRQKINEDVMIQFKPREAQCSPNITQVRAYSKVIKHSNSTAADDRIKSLDESHIPFY